MLIRFGRDTIYIIRAIMVNQPNTIYEIRYDFDLNGETLEMPEGCTLKFEGGSLRNGTLSGVLDQAYIDASKFQFDIQDLVNYCIKYQMNLYFPAGEYVLDKTINVGQSASVFSRKYISIYGDGDNTIIRCKNGFIDIARYGMLKICNLRIESISDGDDVGIHIKNSMYFSFENVKIYNFNIGIYLENAVHYTKWIHCEIVSNKHNGIAFKGYGEENVYAGPNSNFFTQCKLSAPAISIDIKGADSDATWKTDNICFTNCTIEYPATEDGGYDDGKLITLENCIAITFIGCRLESVGTQDIYLNSNCSYCNFIGNTYDGLKFIQESVYQGNLLLPSTHGVNRLSNLVIAGSEFTLDSGATFIMGKSQNPSVCYCNTKIGTTNSYKKKYPNGVTELYTASGNIVSYNKIAYLNNSNNTDGKWYNVLNGVILDYSIIPNTDTIVKPKDISLGGMIGSMFIDKNTFMTYIVGVESSPFLNLLGLPAVTSAENPNTEDSIYENVRLSPVISNTKDKLPYYSNGYSYKRTKSAFRGNSSNRPVLDKYDNGFQYFDTSIQKLIVWNGSKWQDVMGNPADAKQQGATSDRPTGVNIGYIYKDTTLGKLIIWDGSTWVNMDGTALS